MLLIQLLCFELLPVAIHHFVLESVCPTHFLSAFIVIEDDPTNSLFEWNDKQIPMHNTAILILVMVISMQ